jgi:X-X-X-Leu-X-X-Gly heptad repeat protein
MAATVSKLPWAPHLPERYVPLEILGAGAIGVVYRVHDRELERDVALKTLRGLDPNDLFLLKREFRALADVEHRNLVRLYDLDVGAEHAFFTMELVLGRDFLTEFGPASRAGASGFAALQAGARQLAAGLATLHDRGKLHRDVKPSNVLVERGGRVVLLDFGLAIGTESALSIASQRGGFAGTLAYGAPEQVWGYAISPAADWYAMGVVLYECITGRLPFEAEGIGALLDRKQRDLRAPRSLVPDVPDELDALAVDLLRYEPDARPGDAEVMQRLAEAPALTPRRRSAPSLSERFVGRGPELVRLAAAFARARTGRGRQVVIEGPSGIGKTTLLERFARTLEIEEGAVVLRSRCHPREAVAFEALDGLVDDLTRFLVNEPPERVDAFRPRGLPALCRLFPVVSRVPFGVHAGEDEPSDTDPAEVRRRAFAALRELLARIADRRALVLWVDDAQWGDVDCAPFLRDLLRGPDRPSLLLLLSYPSEDRETSALLRALRDADADAGDAATSSEAIELEPLSLSDTRALLGRLLAEAGGDARARAEALAGETGGVPFFASEIARFFERPSADSASLGSGGIALESLIRQRTLHLASDAADLLALVAVAGRPIAASLVLDSLGAGGRGRPHVYALCNESFLRTRSSGRELDVYHVRIREAVLAGLDPGARRALHFRLAEALTRTPDADPDPIFEHYLGAGEAERAAPYAAEAARRAERALAFERAASLYESAWRLAGARDADWELQTGRARSLANAGRGSEAAGAFRLAAEVGTRGGAPAHEVLRMRGRVAEQHFFASDLDLGLAALHEVLGELGVRLPRSQREAQRQAMLRRLRFALRGARLRIRAAGELPPAELARLEVLSGAARGASMLDVTLSDALATHHLLAALDAGEPSHALRALGLEASLEALVGGRLFRARSRRLTERVAELARHTRDPFDLAWVECVRSSNAWMAGAWQRSVDHGTRAVELLRARCIGITFDVVTQQAYVHSALVYLGRLRELARRIPALLEDARTRGDRYALSVFRLTDAGMLALAGDDPERAEVDAQAEERPRRSATFTANDYIMLQLRTHVALYRGDGARARALVEGAWPALGKAGYLRLECISTILRHLRARAALAVGDAPLAAAEARRLARTRLPHVPGMSAAIRAGVARAEADPARAEAELERAIDAFGAAEMHLYEACARRRLGESRGGVEGAALVARADDWLQAEGVVRPPAMAWLLIPGAGAPRSP